MTIEKMLGGMQKTAAKNSQAVKQTTKSKKQSKK
jgi:hypothetical protein